MAVTIFFQRFPAFKDKLFHVVEFETKAHVPKEHVNPASIF